MYLLSDVIWAEMDFDGISPIKLKNTLGKLAAQL